MAVSASKTATRLSVIWQISAPILVRDSELDTSKSIDVIIREYADLDSAENGPVTVGGLLGIVDDGLYEKGLLDAGCGTFSYKVYNSFTDYRKFKRECFKKDDMEAFRGDVQLEPLSRSISETCGDGLWKYTIRKGDKSTSIQKKFRKHKVFYQYNRWWKEGCKLASWDQPETADWGPTEVYVSRPFVRPDEAGNNLCSEVMFKNWKECNDGGVGGSIQYGCVVYEFKAYDKDRTW